MEVFCLDGGMPSLLEVRLIGKETNPASGRVEVRRRDKSDSWGTVCDESFDYRDARVVCRMLGYR